MEWIVTFVVVVVAAFALGMASYVMGSFYLAYTFGERRAVGSFFREVLRETLWAIFTQPLLPLFYFIGRRLAGGSGTPVVFVHGYSQNRVNFLYLARALGKRGRGPLYGFNYAWLRDLPTIARSLGEFIDEIRAETGASKVDLVCHSMGGLVAAQYLAHEGGGDKVRRWATIATPHKGVAYKGPIIGRASKALRSGHGLDKLPDLPLLSIYSTHDNVVFPASSSHIAEPGTNLALAGFGHLAILFVPATADAIAGFLEAPDAPKKAIAVPVEAPAGA
ncbi:MAG: alpha/beta fold hydrolase [Polyangiaceae bacterium]|nr:alpha/beta fold hydrolase [Polyangiaceae bacterium]